MESIIYFSIYRLYTPSIRVQVNEHNNKTCRMAAIIEQINKIFSCVIPNIKKHSTKKRQKNTFFKITVRFDWK